MNKSCDDNTKSCDDIDESCENKQECPDSKHSMDENLNLSAQRFREGLLFVKEIEWGLGDNWIVAMISPEVAMIIRKVVMILMKCMKILIWQPNAFAKGCFSVKEIEWGLGGNWIVATK